LKAGSAPPQSTPADLRGRPPLPRPRRCRSFGAPGPDRRRLGGGPWPRIGGWGDRSPSLGRYWGRVRFPWLPRFRGAPAWWGAICWHRRRLTLVAGGCHRRPLAPPSTHYPRTTGESPAQCCAGPSTAAFTGIVPLPGGGGVQSWMLTCGSIPSVCGGSLSPGVWLWGGAEAKAFACL
jgi:hypothetical protein